MFSVNLNFEKKNSLLWIFKAALVDHRKIEEIYPRRSFILEMLGLNTKIYGKLRIV